ncbi:MAG: response regulator [Acidobacteria bacterium]|nr:response regulator [Acidobacteriota bacterium]
MGTALKILHLEDNDRDAELIKEILISQDVVFDILQVKDRESFIKAFDKDTFDLIFSDYSIPSFSGKLALEIAQERSPETPFIYISGTIGEERAIESIKNGATDYVLKHKLAKLLPAVTRALRETKERSEHKNADIKIRRQVALIDIAPDAIQEVDFEGNILFWSKGAERIYGWAAQEAINKNAKDLMFKNDPNQFINTAKNVIEKGEWFGELKQVTKSGKEIVVESRLALVKDNVGGPISQLIVNTDITEKKKLEAQFLRAQRMECVGALASGIAHDLNNVLAPIMMFIHLLKNRLPDEKSQKLLSMLESSSQRGADLVKQVLSFGRGLESQRIPIQVSHLISEIQKVISETFPRNIRPVVSIEKDLWAVLADTTQIHQVLMNLCVNARDAMPHGGTLHLLVENIFIDEDYSQKNPDANTGPYVLTTVTDTGEGMSQEIIDRIFEPFFTTKEIGKGTGLGLPTVFSIVKAHDGFISLKSEVGKGTTFKIYLPAISVEKPLVDKTQPHDLFSGKGELVLVVDDEVSICEITKASLEANNYEVLTANDGTEAVTIYLQHKERISLVITDAIMPFMDGLATIKALRNINPGVKVVIVSGVASNNMLNDVNYNVSGILTKPYTAEQLLKMVKEVVNK